MPWIITATRAGIFPCRSRNEVSQTLVTKRVPVQYPPEARNGRIQGKVELRTIVGVDGRVHALHIVVGHPLLAAASYNAVRLWEFKPYVLDGKTLPMDTRLTVNFTLIVAEGLQKSTSPFWRTCRLAHSIRTATNKLTYSARLLNITFLGATLRSAPRLNTSLL